MLKRIPLYSWLLDPAGVVSVIFVFQLLMWLAFMPLNPSIYGIAPRFESAEALAKFILLFLLLFNGLIAGKLLINSLRRNSRSGPPEELRHLLFRRVAALALLLSAVGEAFYVRNILFNRALFANALDQNGFAVIGQSVREDSISGLTSLVNLFVVPVAIYGIFAFGRRYSADLRRKYRIYLIAIGTVVVMHSFLLAARMFLIYFVSILFSVYLLEYRPDSTRFFKLLLLGLALGVVVIVGGELLRFGWQQSIRLEEPLFSGPIVQLTVEYLIQAYLASDINNALILLAADPSYQMASTSQLAGSLLSSWFGMKFYGFETIPNWSSKYGTVNVLGQWWFDMGWLSLLWVFVCGAALGALYRLALSRANVQVSYPTLVYLISFPGFFSLGRVNYFSLSIFILPLAYLLVTYLFAGLTVRGPSGRPIASRNEAGL